MCRAEELCRHSSTGRWHRQDSMLGQHIRLLQHRTPATSCTSCTSVDLRLSIVFCLYRSVKCYFHIWPSSLWNFQPITSHLVSMNWWLVWPRHTDAVRFLWLRSLEHIDFCWLCWFTDACMVWCHRIFPTTSSASPIPITAVSGRCHPHSVWSDVHGCPLSWLCVSGAAWHHLSPNAHCLSELPQNLPFFRYHFHPTVFFFGF